MVAGERYEVARLVGGDGGVDVGERGAHVLHDLVRLHDADEGHLKDSDSSECRRFTSRSLQGQQALRSQPPPHRVGNEEQVSLLRVGLEVLSGA